MKLEIRAVRVSDGEMATFKGADVEAISFDDAQNWCDEFQPYLKVIGRLTSEGEMNENGEWVITSLDEAKNN